MATGVINRNLYLLGVFEDEKKIIAVTKKARETNVAIHDVFTPYPVHGLDDAMGIKRSRLPRITLLAGFTGFMFAMLVQVWLSSIDWPIIVGGKPFNSVPAFVPITFELTVLFGGLATVAAFFYVTKLFPGKIPQLMDDLITDKHFVIALKIGGANLDAQVLTKFLKEQGAVVVKEKEVLT